MALLALPQAGYTTSKRRSVDVVRNHPVMPPHVRISGFVMDSVTGKLVQVACP